MLKKHFYKTTLAGQVLERKTGIPRGLPRPKDLCFYIPNRHFDLGKTDVHISVHQPRLLYLIYVFGAVTNHEFYKQGVKFMIYVKENRPLHMKVEVKTTDSPIFNWLIIGTEIEVDEFEYNYLVDINEKLIEHLNIRWPE